MRRLIVLLLLLVLPGAACTFEFQTQPPGRSHNTKLQFLPLRPRLMFPGMHRSLKGRTSTTTAFVLPSTPRWVQVSMFLKM